MFLLQISRKCCEFVSCRSSRPDNVEIRHPTLSFSSSGRLLAPLLPGYRLLLSPIQVNSFNTIWGIYRILEWIHRFLWCTTVRVTLDHWSWSGLYQGTHPSMSYIRLISILILQLDRVVFNWMSYTITTDTKKQWTNQNSNQIHAACALRGKTRMSRLVLLLVGWASGASTFFFNQ